ncbi:hypothetical protein T310_9145, partial [Rasamsonia emersonii CBS 393.64]
DRPVERTNGTRPPSLHTRRIHSIMGIFTRPSRGAWVWRPARSGSGVLPAYRLSISSPEGGRSISPSQPSLSLTPVFLPSHPTQTQSFHAADLFLFIPASVLLFVGSLPSLSLIPFHSFFFLSSLRIARYSPAQGLVVGYGVSELVESRFCPLEGAAPCSFSCLFSLLPVT